MSNFDEKLNYALAIVTSEKVMSGEKEIPKGLESLAKHAQNYERTVQDELKGLRNRDGSDLSREQWANLYNGKMSEYPKAFTDSLEKKETSFKLDPKDWTHAGVHSGIEMLSDTITGQGAGLGGGMWNMAQSLITSIVLKSEYVLGPIRDGISRVWNYVTGGKDMNWEKAGEMVKHNNKLDRITGNTGFQGAADIDKLDLEQLKSTAAKLTDVKASPDSGQQTAQPQPEQGASQEAPEATAGETNSTEQSAPSVGPATQASPLAMLNIKSINPMAMVRAQEGQSWESLAASVPLQIPLDGSKDVSKEEFKTLDANDDNKLTLEEIPKGMQEQFKAMLSRQPRGSDGKAPTELELGSIPPTGIPLDQFKLEESKQAPGK